MRGKLCLAYVDKVLAGITPAHAGKTAHPSRRACWRWDHPRACGENCTGLMRTPERLGSPPRMRGKHFPAGYTVRERGITPAHAGKTCHIQFRQSPCWDHPRACGENNTTTNSSYSPSGSPPRMRGKLRRACRTAS